MQLLSEDKTQRQKPRFRNQILAMALKISTHLQFPSPATKLHCHRVFSEQPHYHLPHLNILFPNNQLLLRRGSKNVGFRGVVVRSMAGGLEPQTATEGRPEMFVKAPYSPPSWASELHPAPSHFVSLGQVNIKNEEDCSQCALEGQGSSDVKLCSSHRCHIFFQRLKGFKSRCTQVCVNWTFILPPISLSDCLLKSLYSKCV